MVRQSIQSLDWWTGLDPDYVIKIVLLRMLYNCSQPRFVRFVDAFAHKFRHAVHLTCFIHLDESRPSALRTNFVS